MITINDIDLKTCPFCGGEAQLLIVGKQPNGEEEWYVSCENVNCSLHPHSTIPYASAEIAAEAWNRRAENTRSAPVGDSAAMREALVAIQKLVQANISADEFDDLEPLKEYVQIRDICNAAIAKPPRQCDVGTAEEQAARYAEYCDTHLRDDGSKPCTDCPCCGKIPFGKCEFAWAQTPYEEGGAV